MLKHLKKINHRFYSHFDERTGMLFTMRYGDRGCYGNGKAWYLSVTYSGVNKPIATFSTMDDGHGSRSEDYLGRIWDQNEALMEADMMVGRMIER